jgi:hypothetical protein
MKKSLPLTVSLFIIFTLGSCEKYLGNATSNLNGSWDIYTMTTKYYTQNKLDSSNIQDDMGTFTFHSDGSGDYYIEDGDQTSSGSFDWFEKNDKVFINLINFSDSIMTDNLAVGFDVITNTANQQVWSLSYSYYQEEENPSTGYLSNYLKKVYMEFDLRK